MPKTKRKGISEATSIRRSYGGRQGAIGSKGDCLVTI
ncbi:putative 50S ribosomal subunit protein L28 [Candidatus Tremblaya phenacola PAVE]|nr:putative 50S ribosomal subunit protein L28 [Candidatus Tremblaya phenacola PAVE]